MALFGIGASASKQSSQSQSTSLDFGNSASQSASFSQGVSQATSGGQSTQNVAFEDLFRQLFQGATGAANTAAQNTPLFEGESAQLFSGGLGFLDQLQGNAGSDYLANRVTGPDQAAQAQLGALGQNLGDFFNEQLLPGITGRGVSTGTLGGSRQAVAQSLAAKQVSGQYAQGAAQILGQSQQQRDAAASTLGGQGIQAAGTGLQALPQLLGLAQAGANAQLSPYLALAQILGGPTVLTQSSQFGQSTSSDLAQALSNAFSQNYSESQSTSSSKGKSIGIDYGFGANGAKG